MHTHIYTHTHSHSVLSMYVCYLAGIGIIHISLSLIWHQQQDRRLHTHMHTHVCFQPIQTQWTLVAQLAVRQKGKWCRAEGGMDEKWNLSSYCLSLVISPSPPSLYFSLSFFLPISYLSVVWRTPADASLSLEVSQACAAIFFLLITAQSPT